MKETSFLKEDSENLTSVHVSIFYALFAQTSVTFLSVTTCAYRQPAIKHCLKTELLLALFLAWGDQNEGSWSLGLKSGDVPLFVMILSPADIP